MDLLTNARIRTLDHGQPLASCLLVDGERVRAVGGDELRREWSGRAREHDLGGAVVLPGLTDGHLHLKEYAFLLQKVDCETATLEECLRRVAVRHDELTGGEWLLGHGWNQNAWSDAPSGGYGHAADLDRAAPGRPVYLTAKSLHAGWASSEALRLAGIDGNTPDPEGGRVQRDESGRPTGILFEKACRLVSTIVPRPSVEDAVQAIRAAQPSLWRLGLTGVHDFDYRTSLLALQRLHADGDLRLRVVKSIPLDDFEYALEHGLHTGLGDDLLRIGGLKLFMDGALGPRTAAMLEPYESEAGNRGMLILDAEQVFELGCRAARAGLSLAVHAMGDLANRAALEAIERLRAFERAEDLPALRHRIEHVQLLHPDDLSRPAALQVLASMQPVHVLSDMQMAERHWGGRTAGAYAWQSLRSRGARLVFGSDAPVETPDPWLGLYAALTRRRPDGFPGPDGWHPAERLDLQAALEGFTLGPAFAAGMEDRLGRLAPGCLADLIVLARDPFECQPEELASLRPSAVMVGGEWVWQG